MNPRLGWVRKGSGMEMETVYYNSQHILRGYYPSEIKIEKTVFSLDTLPGRAKAEMCYIING